ncbi:uncharacterized protein V1510DRAFT_417897, partial [Dipodascopsis tothii]|uniref:uncharacterized protein n=1 Tax=Dipodascopsis tothii TaxID=44089 RepID=UPI0034CD5989
MPAAPSPTRRRVTVDVERAAAGGTSSAESSAGTEHSSSSQSSHTSVASAVSDVKAEPARESRRGRKSRSQQLLDKFVADTPPRSRTPSGQKPGTLVSVSRKNKRKSAPAPTPDEPRPSPFFTAVNRPRPQSADGRAQTMDDADPDPAELKRMRLAAGSGYTPGTRGPSKRAEFAVYRCRWAGCPAELHNLDALTRHIKARHKNTCKCLWKDCFSAARTRYTFVNDEERLAHVMQSHVGPLLAKLGPGPDAPALRPPNTTLFRGTVAVTPLACPAPPGHRFVPPRGYEVEEQSRLLPKRVAKEMVALRRSGAGWDSD